MKRVRFEYRNKGIDWNYVLAFIAVSIATSVCILISNIGI